MFETNLYLIQVRNPIRYVSVGLCQKCIACLFKCVLLYLQADADIFSGKAKRILSDPEGRKVYLDAIDKLVKDKEKEATVRLKNKEQFTLIID